jgi:A/G-specific adenine glycosylase
MSKPFTQLLLKWNKTSNHRPMPWKGEPDPYKIWLSEIILQQTRVEQGWAYYERFVKNYPTIFKLAKAKDQEVFKLWEGLGYYNRCRNLLHTARFIVDEYNGIFPNNYEALLALKGIGPYTAAAIASFAFNLPHAVVDGNVFRVFSRFYGIANAIDTREGIQIFNQVANENLDPKKAGIYNQALMDFGATVCKPMGPLCNDCILQKECVAFNRNQVNVLPFKVKQIQKKKRYFDFFIFNYKNNWLLQKRGQEDIWAGLYQFYLVENNALTLADAAYFKQVLQQQLAIKQNQVMATAISDPMKQLLTHQHLTVRFIEVALKSKPIAFSKALWIPKANLNKYPFPKLIADYLKKKA